LKMLELEENLTKNITNTTKLLYLAHENSGVGDK